MRIRDGQNSDPGWKKVGYGINIPDLYCKLEGEHKMPFNWIKLSVIHIQLALRFTDQFSGSQDHSAVQFEKKDVDPFHK